MNSKKNGCEFHPVLAMTDEYLQSKIVKSIDDNSSRKVLLEDGRIECGTHVGCIQMTDSDDI